MFIGTHQGHVALGLDAGRNLTDSHHNQYNVFIGQNSGTGTNTGDSNVGVGTGTLFYNQKGNFNTAIGHDAAKFLQHSNDNGTTTSNADVDMYNTCIGYNAMPTSKQGTNNTIVGANAGYQLKANGNIAIGRSALSAEDYGNSAVAIGNYALNFQNDVTSSSGSNSTTGNVAVGHSAGKHLEEGLDCTFIGSQAGFGSNANRLDGHDNTAVGSQAGYSLITTAAGNTLMGTKAGYLQTTANNNVVIGYNASYYNLTGGTSVFVGVEAGKHTRSGTGSNTIIGYKAMQNGHSTYDDNIAHSNTVMGAYAMGENTDAALTSLRNCILGAYAGKEMLSSDDCILIGYSAGSNLTTGNNNTIIGNYAGANLTDNAKTMCVGYKAGQELVSGAAENTFIGFEAGSNLGSADNDGNTSIGFKALNGGSETHANNTAQYNTAIGAEAYGGATVADFTATSGVCIGYEAGKNITTGSSNVLIGKSAGDSITTGEQNVGIGTEALGVLGTGKFETAVGYYALSHVAGTNAAGSLNAAFGYQAGKFVSSGRLNTFLGAYSGVGITGTRLTGNNNTGVGYYTLYKIQGSADSNAVFGGAAAQELTTGSLNTFLGSKAGENVVTGSNNICVGFHTETSATDVNYEIVIGAGVDGSNAFTGGGTETCRIGRASDYISVDFGENATWSHSSDKRIKKDINDNKLGLEFINELRTVTYKKKAPSEYPTFFKGYNPNEIKRKNSDKKYYGFIAQEVKEAMKSVGNEDFTMWNEEEDSMQTLSETSLIVPLVKAIQELSKEITELKRRINE